MRFETKMSLPIYCAVATFLLTLCSYAAVTLACSSFSEFRRPPKHPQALFCEADFAFRAKVLRSYRVDHYLRTRCQEELNIRDRRSAPAPGVPGIPDYILDTSSSSSQTNESQQYDEFVEDDFPQLPCPLTSTAINDYHRLWQSWTRLNWNLEDELSGDGRLPEQVFEIVYVPGPAVITTVYLVTIIKVFKGEEYVTERDVAHVFSWGLNLHSDFIYIMTGHVHKDNVVEDNDRSEEVRNSMLEGQLNVMSAHWVCHWTDITRHQEKGLLGFYRENCHCSILQCQSGRSHRECAMEAIRQGYSKKDNTNYCSWRADDFMCLHYFSACVNSSNEDGHRCVWNWHRDMRICNRHLPTSIEKNHTGHV